MKEAELVIDLRGQVIETLDDFWDAVREPCGLPVWFGRNLDAWGDTIDARGVSEVIDRHDTLTVHVRRQGLFADVDTDKGNPKGRGLAATFDGVRNRLVLHP
ncbi:barstar family protein [Streptomyces sp. NRRL F-5630]|uniref:barstar family protein n=1 Tax=Streptomyces sp. NRRL F-5630 TaxID=1463864 RepID=UPI003D75CC73